MQRTILKSKLAYVKITEANLYYEGSLTIDENWMDEANIFPNEQIHVVNVQNGERLITYAIPGPRGSGIICLNGPAARRGLVGDELIIITYAQIDSNEHSSGQPLIAPVVVNKKDTQ
jgi:aspartate 1-decarboxylase